MHRVNFDTGCDQGYGSERSPEEEVPPPLNGVVDPFINVNNNTGPIQQQQPPSGAITAMNPLPGQSSNDCSYDFITKGEMRVVGRFSYKRQVMEWPHNTWTLDCKK